MKLNICDDLTKFRRFKSAFVKTLCIENNIPYQVFFNRSDVRGGSTLGNISISQESILTADIGMPQLAMHSSFETIGSEDTKHMFNLMSSFFKTVFKIDNDKITFLNPGKASKIL